MRQIVVDLSQWVSQIKLCLLIDTSVLKFEFRLEIRLDANLRCAENKFASVFVPEVWHHRWSGCDFLGGLSAGSVAILFLSVDVSKRSHSTGTSSVSSDSLYGPHISSLLVVNTATSWGVTLLLLVKVRFSTESTDTMGVGMLLTSGGSTSSHLFA